MGLYGNLTKVKKRRFTCASLSVLGRLGRSLHYRKDGFSIRFQNTSYCSVRQVDASKPLQTTKTYREQVSGYNDPGVVTGVWRDPERD